MTKLLDEIRRLGWLLAISVGMIALADWDKIQLAIYKVGLVTLTCILVHLVRKQNFPYIDLSVALESNKDGKAIGTALFLGLIYLAAVLGVTLGL